MTLWTRCGWSSSPFVDREGLEIAAVVAGGCEAGVGELAGYVGGCLFQLR